MSNRNNIFLKHSIPSSSYPPPSLFSPPHSLLILDVKGVVRIRNQLKSMAKYENLIRDDFQRFGFDNWRSGVLWACQVLGVDVE